MSTDHETKSNTDQKRCEEILGNKKKDEQTNHFTLQYQMQIYKVLLVGSNLYYFFLYLAQATHESSRDYLDTRAWYFIPPLVAVCECVNVLRREYIDTAFSVTM